MLLLASPVHAADYYVIVSGLIGEPDYAQRFDTAAKDLDKVLRATGADAHVYTLTGGEATRARLTQVLEQVALEAFQYADRKTAEFYTSQKRLATEHAVFEDTGKGEAVRTPSTDAGEGRLLASLTLVRFGGSQQAALDPAKRDLLVKKEDLERRIDVLKYQKAAMTESAYEQRLKALLLELARVPAALDKKGET